MAGHNFRFSNLSLPLWTMVGGSKIRLQRVLQSRQLSHYSHLTACNMVVHYSSEAKYRVIHKSVRDFRPLRHSSRDGHAEGEHVNRGSDTWSFCPNLQVLDMSNIGDVADINPVIRCGRNLITKLTYAASPRVDTSSTCKVGQKIGVSLPLLECPPSAWPSRLLYRRGRKSRRDLRITL